MEFKFYKYNKFQQVLQQVPQTMYSDTKLKKEIKREQKEYPI